MTSRDPQSPAHARQAIDHRGHAREQSRSRTLTAGLLDQHERIVAAIEERDPQAAEERMREHIRAANLRFPRADDGGSSAPG